MNMSKSQTYLDAVERLKAVDWANLPTFPDEVKVDGITYIQSEIGGRENKLPSGEELGVYMPKCLDYCLKIGIIKLTSEQAKKIAV
jgi:hypothetical protein